MLRTLIAVAVVTATLAVAAEPAEAQRYRARGRARVGVVIIPTGLYVGGGVAGAAILDQRGGSELLESGAGLSLFSGIRLHPRLALELGWMATFHNPVEVDTVFGSDVDFLVLNGFTGDARVYLDSANPNMEPFVQGGLGLYLLDSTYFGAQSVGTGFQLGGGLDVRIADRLKLGVRGLYRGIAMGPPEGGADDTFVSALTLDGNLMIEF